MLDAGLVDLGLQLELQIAAADDHSHIRVLLFHLQQHVPTRYFRRPDVEQDSIDSFLVALIDIERRFSIAGREDLVSPFKRIFSRRSSMFFSFQPKGWFQ